MTPEFEYLLSNIMAYPDPQHGPSIKLIDFEHLDYIDDVISDKFELDHALTIEDEEKRKFILHYEDRVTLEELRRIVNEINLHHANGQETYKTNFNND